MTKPLLFPKQKNFTKCFLPLLYFLIFPFLAIGQTTIPQYFNSNTGSSNNSFPLNSTTNKVQWIYGPNLFNSNGPTGIPAFQGLIDKVYFRLATANANTVYSDFTISLAQNVGTQNSWTSATYNTNMTQVFYAATHTMTGAMANDWYGVTLTTPFLYDPTQSLVFELQVSAGTGNGVSQATNAGLNQRIWGSYGATVGTNFGTALVDFGFDLAPFGPCVAPPTAGTTVVNTTVTCIGGPLQFNLTGNTFGQNQTYQWEASTTAAGPYNAISPILTAPFFGTTGAGTFYYRCAVTCGTSTEYSNPVLVTHNPPFPSGVYTINSGFPTAGTNFQNFTDAAAALSCGITGPIIFNVEPNSGPYNEQITITEIFGSSSTNTVIFNGNGNTITFAPNATNRHIIRLDNASYVAFANLNVVSTDPNNGIGFHLINGASNNIINNCNINLSSTFGSTSLNTTGILIQNGNFNGILNSTVTGGYYGVYIAGASATANAIGNMVNNNTLADWYIYGVYLANASNTLVIGNDISRPTRTTLTTFYGIGHFTSGSNNLYDGNKIHSPFATTPTSTLSAYGIWHSSVKAAAGNENRVINNAIYNMNSNGLVYAIQNSSSDSIHYLHNTISLDYTASTSGTIRGFFQTGAANGIAFRNNIISITNGGTTAKHCIYLGTAASNVVSNNNVFHLNSPGTSNGIGFYSSNQATLANWQTANNGAYDQNSVAANPQFLSAAQGQLYPTNLTIDNLGVPLGIFSDITGAPRSSTTPDKGAYEFSPISKDVEISGINSAMAPCYDTGDSLKVTVKNIGVNTLDFSVDTLFISYSVSGPTIMSGTAAISSGILAPNATMLATLSTAFNTSAIGTYQLSATVGSSWDQISFNNNTSASITVNPVNVMASGDTICNGSDVLLAMTGFPGPIQWQVNTGGGFTNISNATNISTMQTITQNVSFRALYCNKISDTLTVAELTLQAPVVTNDTVCSGQSGTVTASTSLQNTTIGWFNNPTGGAPVGSGNSHTISNATATTNVYAQNYRLLNSAVATVGTGTTSNTGTTYPAPFGNWFGGTRSQFLYLASEMTAAGASSGAIGSIAFNVTNLNTAVAHQGFTIWIKATNTTSLTAHETGTFTQVFGPITYMPTLGWNVFTFSTPFMWNGVDNIVIETCFNNLTWSNNVSTQMTTNLPFTASRYFIADNNPNVCTSTTSTAISDRPNCRFDLTVGCASTRALGTLVVNPNPTVNAGSNLAFCDGNSVSINGSVSGGTAPLNISWTPTTGLSSTTIANPVANPAATTNYTLSAVDVNGCSGTSNVTVTVNALPAITANASSPEVCAGSTVTLSGSGTGTGNITYTWDNTVTNNIPFTPASTQIYTVTGKDANNCENTDQVEVIVNPLPIVTASATATAVCDGDMVTLTGAGAPTLIWNHNVMDDVAFTPSSTLIYTVTGTDNNNCSNTDEIQVVVNPLPIVEANTSASAVCAGNQVTLFGTGADSYVWDNPVVNNVPFTPAATLTYTVTGTDANNCSNSDIITVTVNPLPELTINASSNAICYGDDVTITASGANTYVWTPNITNGVPFNPTATQTYSVVGTDNNNCSSTDQIQVVVNPLPTVSLANFQTTCTYYAPFELTGGIPAGGNYSVGGSPAPNNIFNPGSVTLGFHSILYVYTDANGCSASAMNTIEVSACIGVEETTMNAGNVKVYPNPAYNRFVLEITSLAKEDAEIRMYNSNGKVVRSERAELINGVNKFNFDASEYARGVYYITIHTNSSSVNHKIVLN